MTRLDRIAALTSLSLETNCLNDLINWEPVGSLLSEIPDIARGHGNLSMSQIQRLRRWASRWKLIAEPLRGFYREEFSDPTVDAGVVESAVWRILEGQGRPPLTGRQKGALRARWADRYGYTPQMELCPKPFDHKPRPGYSDDAGKNEPTS